MSTERLVKQAKAKAAKYCSLRERAPSQVMEKLLGWELEENVAHQILTELVQENYVNEERFARAYCHDKFEFNKWGKQRIRMELSRLKVGEDLIQEGLNSIDPDHYWEILQGLGKKKYESLRTETDPWKRKQKTTAYLLRKGFEMDFCIEIVNRLSDSQH
ncbi:regulatory protein RecX [Marinoscillum sp.]|uniref:regulatory protein RecX n=1 Tax=Marinoscillum sp. TaxID=2024838 RepID=UPI003BABE690